MLGLKPEHYLYLSPIGKELLDNKQLFLSKKAAQAFGGYATAQLRRLDNKAARLVGQAQKEQHVLNSINNVMADFNERYTPYADDAPDQTLYDVLGYLRKQRNSNIQK